MMLEMLHPLVLDPLAILPAEDIFSWTASKGTAALSALRVVSLVLLGIFAIWIFAKSKGRIGAILGGLAVLAIAGWILLGGGWKWGSEVVEDTVNSSAVVGYELPQNEG